MPDATGRGFVQGTLGAAIGSSVITQANLPAVNLIGGNHGHSISDPGHSHVTNINNATFNGSTNGAERFLNNGGITLNDNITSGFGSTASATGISVQPSGNLTVPLGGAGAAYTPASIGVNQFVYLGA